MGVTEAHVALGLRQVGRPELDVHGGAPQHWHDHAAGGDELGDQRGLDEPVLVERLLEAADAHGEMRLRLCVRCGRQLAHA